MSLKSLPWVLKTSWIQHLDTTLYYPHKACGADVGYRGCYQHVPRLLLESTPLLFKVSHSISSHSAWYLQTYDDVAVAGLTPSFQCQQRKVWLLAINLRSVHYFL